MRIVIFKAESGSFDKYTKVLHGSEIEVELIPSIEFKFKNIEQLAAKLRSPEAYSGVVFSSPRCAQATKLCNEELSNWKSKLNFSIGETTYAEALSSLQLETVGKNSGNAQALGEYILKNHQVPLPLLYPCGNLKQDTLGNILEGKISLEPVEVYETVPHVDLQKNLLRVLEDPNLEVLVFFSPSGVNFCTKISEDCKKMTEFSQKKIVSIGPSTTKAIQAKSLKVYAQAETPSPEGLLMALNQHKRKLVSLQ